MTETLFAPRTVRALLERYGLRAEKSFGQNFLVDSHALEAIVKAAALDRSDTVLEVGPGLGVLTRELVDRAGRVIAIELDRRLAPVLEETVGTAAGFELVLGDAMTFELSQLPVGSLLVANLPYNVATPLIARALAAERFRRLVVMVQKEVAERLVAKPGTAAYGAVSLLVAHFAEPRIVRHVGPASFYPPPDVTSSIVRLDVRADRRDDPALFTLVRGAFRHRRKTLQKNLQMAGYDREAVTAALLAEGLDPRARAEDLGLSQFEGLRRRLHPGT